MPEVTSEIQSTERRRPLPEEGPLSIIFEDEWIIVLDKPPGIVVHPTYKNWSGTLLNSVLWRVRDRAGVQPGILTRLDKNTSGLVVMALTPEVHAAMQRDQGAGRVRKEYLAVVQGTPEPPSGTISLPLGRDLADRRRVVVTDTGAPSETRYDAVIWGQGWGQGSCPTPSLSPDHSLVRCELVTGRTHQIRVHLAARGWPILGDAQYGIASTAIARQALHAWRVRLPHPITRQPIDLEAPIPPDMRALVQNVTL
jgi:23S rRNA pseudouridine1911/1915/1917 synthase